MAADSGASEETPEICRAVPDEEEGRRLDYLHRSADAGHDADAWSFHRYKARGHHRHRAEAGFEMDNARFIKHISLNSYFYASIISISFTIIVNIVTHFNLKKINMIESLKSVE